VRVVIRMKALQIARQVGRLFRKRERRIAMGARRAYVQLRDLQNAELPALADALKALVEPLEQMEWVEVNAHTGRVVFAYREHGFGRDDLLTTVEQAENATKLSAAQFSERQHHPADVDEGAQLLVELFADVVATAVGLGLRVS